MDDTFKAVLEDVLLKVKGGNRGAVTQTIEAWTQNACDDNLSTAIETEYGKQQLARQIYTVKMQQARKKHSNAQ